MTWSWAGVAGVMAGILLFGHPQQFAFSLFLAASLGLVSARKRGLMLVFVGFALIAWGRCWWEERRLPHWENGPIEVAGRVVETPRKWGRGSAFTLATPRGRLFVVTRTPLEVWPGDRWWFAGTIEEPGGATYPGGFDLSQWLRAQGLTRVLTVGRFDGLARRLGPAPWWSLYRLRAVMLTNLRGHLEGQRLSLLAGIVFGETRGLDDELLDQFRRTGTTHLLAASGLNVALVAGLVLFLAQPLGMAPWRLAPVAAVAGWFYSVLAGGSPSVVRAAVMSALALAAMALGRTTDLGATLSLSVVGCLLWRPGFLVDIGFQMSVLAVLGLILFLPGLEARLKGLPGWFGGPLAVTLAATLAILPVVVWHFHYLSPISLVANLLMGPVAELLLPLGLLGALLPCQAVFWICRPLLVYLLWVVAGLAALAPQSTLARPTLMGMVALLLAGVWLYLWLDDRPRHGILVICLALSWWGRPLPEARLRAADLGGLVIWRQVGNRHSLYLEKAKLLPRAREMLLKHGVVDFELQEQRPGSPPFLPAQRSLTRREAWVAWD